MGPLLQWYSHAVCQPHSRSERIDLIKPALSVEVPHNPRLVRQSRLFQPGSSPQEGKNFRKPAAAAMIDQARTALSAEYGDSLHPCLV